MTENEKIKATKNLTGFVFMGGYPLMNNRLGQGMSYEFISYDYKDKNYTPNRSAEIRIFVTNEARVTMSIAEAQCIPELQNAWRDQLTKIWGEK